MRQECAVGKGIQMLHIRIAARRFRSGFCTMGLIVCWLAPGPLEAAEVVVKNDSVINGSTAAIQAGFDANESAAVWLTSPCSGNIVAVQIFWRSLTGGTPPSLEDYITINQPGTFPIPGTVLAFLEGPVMNDNFLNEFRYLDEDNTVPISVPILQGQTFAVVFRFASDPNPFLGPSLVTDADGCQAGKNAINAIGLGWRDACSLGVSGDFFIRAVVDCTEATGACCTVFGDCVPGVTQTLCTQNGGTYQGNGSTCQGVNCPLLVGACCMPDGSCQNGLTQSECQGMGGTYQGNESGCGSVSCPQPPQACCNPSNNFCAMLSPQDCTNFGGVPQGSGTVCVGPSANQCPTGACCLPSGACQPSMTATACAAAGGVYQGTGVTCGQVSCPQPQGACCLTSGGCNVSAQAPCEGFGHTWKGSGTNCADANMNGTADICEPPDGDMNRDGDTDGLDIAPFVRAILDASIHPLDLAHGDFSGNGVIDLADVEDMVEVLLAN